MDIELKEGFVITDDNLADWALRKIRDEEAERDRLISIAQNQIQELQEKMKDPNEKCDRDTSFLKGCLAQYMNKVPHKSTKTQETYQLLTGKLVLKKPSQKMIVPDDNKLLDYLDKESYKDYIKTKCSPDWAGFKKILEIQNGDVINKETGEVINPEIIAIEDVPASFDIKLKED